MIYDKKFENGLRLVVDEMDGYGSVSVGILVKTGSVNENEKENGISHFIEHTVFKGTKRRTALQISEEIDELGAQINAFTSKEITCYYTKSVGEQLESAMDVLSDIFFDSVFDENELEKEKGVVIEEINMSEDMPEDLCLDLLAESRYGKFGLGQTILGPEKNVRSFGKDAIREYMSRYYTADNVVVSIAGNVDVNRATDLVNKYFAERFSESRSAKQKETDGVGSGNVFKTKKIEQAHVGLSFPSFSVFDERVDALSVLSAVFGGGMSSRLFQKIREEKGLAYSVYSYPSHYKNCGSLEVYAGVNVKSRDRAFKAILEETEKFGRGDITEKEFERGKAQIKSAFVFGRESTAQEMLLYGKYMLFNDSVFDVTAKIDRINNLTIEKAREVAKEVFDVSKVAVATVGPSEKPLK